jgi:hypothetical protein
VLERAKTVRAFDRSAGFIMNEKNSEWQWGGIIQRLLQISTAQNKQIES